MQKPARLHQGDEVRIVSLSRGALHESSPAQIQRGYQRLRQLGLKVSFGQYAGQPAEQLQAHPEWRAADLKAAFLDPKVKAIITAIGGEDTVRLAPHLFDDPVFKAAVNEQPKIFMGFSDTTVNHLMLRRLGLNTFYGPAFLTDFAELAPEMLPYTARAVQSLFTNLPVQIESSPEWYEERTDFSRAALGTDRVRHPEAHGYEALWGMNQIVQGPLLGGCLESLVALVTGERAEQDRKITQRFDLWPRPAEWQGSLLFLETSEEQPSPVRFEAELAVLEAQGILDQVAGLLVGKPQNEQYYADYRQILSKLGQRHQLPILYNLNFGHAYPRTILPYGIMAELDLRRLTVRLLEAALTE
ncbi:S66 family peptidase [Pediococcus pentosaceus]|uniref:S66 family peptidase n=1 Tax=Pediococcus pentosaceus TaxID=1255 RepID=UPI003981C1A7